MDFLPLLFLISMVVATILFFISKLSNKNPRSSNLPPGPYAFPIIGNIFELGTQPHKALTNLSKTYGPIMTLKLGSITTIIISSPQLAKEVKQMKDNDFSSRTTPDTIRSHDHHILSMVWMPPTTQWKALRKACATKLFSSQQLDSTQIIRQRKLQELMNHIDERCRKGEAVNIGEVVFTTVLNSISNTFFSVDLAHYASDKAQEFKDLVWGGMEEAGRHNVVDFFPILRFLDPQRARARMNNYMGKLIKFFDGLVDERLSLGGEKIESKRCNDLLDSLIELMMEENLQISRPHLLHLFLDLFVAGIDTTSSTVEWVLAEMLCNPQKLEKLKKELQQVLNKDEQFDESHISKLPFLHAIVKETFRLHPPVPFLLPQKSEDDVELSCFMVPKNAQIMINVWAMGRDSTIWDNPNQFIPERFMENKIDFKGRDFELIPFGAGKRICPGLPLANRTIHVMLASLLHYYDWKLCDGLKAEEIDMTEKFGLSLNKAIPLQAIPIKN